MQWLNEDITQPEKVFTSKFLMLGFSSVLWQFPVVFRVLPEPCAVIQSVKTQSPRCSDESQASQTPAFVVIPDATSGIIKTVCDVYIGGFRNV